MQNRHPWEALVQITIISNDSIRETACFRPVRLYQLKTYGRRSGIFLDWQFHVLIMYSEIVVTYRTIKMEISSTGIFIKNLPVFDMLPFHKIVGVDHSKWFLNIIACYPDRMCCPPGFGTFGMHRDSGGNMTEILVDKIVLCFFRPAYGRKLWSYHL